MTRIRKSISRALATWVAILAGHVAAILVLVRLDVPSASSDLPPSPAFVWLPRLEAIPPPPVPVPAAKTQPIQGIARQAPPTRPTAAQPAPVTAPTPSIDWYQQGAIAARQQSSAKTGPQTFSKPPTVLRSACKPKPSHFKWKTPRTGRTVGDLHLPYIKLGKRCVVGLGFFGCNVGALPEVDGHLLDDFRDPDRSTSSVPSIDECVKPEQQ
jgi:hypothetical protein